MDTTEPKTTVATNRRWYRPTPSRLLIVLLAVEVGLLLSRPWIPKGWAVLIAIAAVAVTMVLMLLWFVVALLFRWRFQFSIRSLLVLTVAVAIPCSWLGVETERARRQKEAADALILMYGKVYYEHWALSEWIKAKAPPPPPIWLRELFGRDFFANVVAVDLDGEQIADNKLKLLETLKHVEVLSLQRTHITDAGVAKLQKALPGCKIVR